MDNIHLPTLFHRYPEAKPVFRKFEHHIHSLIRRKNQKFFLEECLQEHVTPRMYGFRRWTPRFEPFPNSHKMFLEERIQYTKNDIFTTRRHMKTTQEQLRLLCPSDATYRYLVSFAFDNARYNSRMHSSTLARKLNNLINHSEWNNIINNDKVMNLSNTPLNVNQHLVLNLGLSFALQPDERSHLDFITGFDKFVSDQNFRKDELCLKGILLSAISELNLKHPVPRRLRLAIESLRKLDVIITKSDKDGKIVILDKDFYLNKANELLNDSDTYEQLNKDPLKNVAADFYKKVRNIGGDKKSIEILEKLKVITPKLPYFYGLPKTHKDNIPLRPIISSIGSFTYNISKWLANLLSPFLGIFSPSHIKHSEDFTFKFNEANIPLHNVKLLSLDVESLFTKVPVNDVLNFLSNKLVPYADHFPLAIDKIMKLTELCVSNNVFTFNGKFYKQKFGCSMGSPLSPVISNLYMEYFETVIIKDIKPKNMIWMRYVDDILTFWDNSWGDFNEFFIRLNNLVPSIKFKVEWEKDNKIPFLDVLIIRDPNRYKFTVYRKPTFSISYIHYFSYHDISIKSSIASNLFLRALRICSPDMRESEFKIIRQQLNSLRYPDHVIEKAIYKANQIFYRPQRSETVNSYQNKIKIPYLSTLKQLVDPLGKRNPFIFSYPKTIGSSVVNVYQKRENKEVGVYTIPCKNCDKSYVGFTNKSLSQRIVEHKRSIRYGQENSAVFKHVSEENHTMDWSASDIVFNSACRYRSQVIESCLIASTNNINTHKGAFKPDLIDNILLETYLRKIRPRCQRPSVT